MPLESENNRISGGRKPELRPCQKSLPTIMSLSCPALRPKLSGFFKNLVSDWNSQNPTEEQKNMKYDQQGPLSAMLSEAAGEAGRSSLTAWLEYRHDALLAELGTKRVRWPIWLELFGNSTCVMPTGIIQRLRPLGKRGNGCGPRKRPLRQRYIRARVTACNPTVGPFRLHHRAQGRRSVCAC